MVVYKITNKINNKCYIGSTNNFERRMKEHIDNSTNQNSQLYSYPLYCAFRKYGVDNFTFEIIEDGILLANIADRELYFINKFNSLANGGHGYNQTLYTYCALQDPEITQKSVSGLKKRCAEIDEFGNIIAIYESLHDCSRKLFNDSNFIYNISATCRGANFSFKGHIIRFIDAEDNIINTLCKKSIYKVCKISVFNLDDIVYYNSVSEAARESNIPRRELQQCINGSKRYSVIKNYIYRKCYDNNEIIDNGISLLDLFDNYCRKCAVNLVTKEVIISDTWKELSNKIKLNSQTIQKYYLLNTVKKDYRFLKIDIFGNLYDSNKILTNKEEILNE